RMFDHIIIRNEKHLRGRTEEEINGLIIEGMQAATMISENVERLQAECLIISLFVTKNTFAEELKKRSMD
ncbi:hypothetical protein, partial [Chryseobacterium sp. CH1]|uniref:hypothetical protein n=1 Tax=Chryseobacterium sp. CH1 TaxID=713551 RepID=UPI001025BB8D